MELTDALQSFKGNVKTMVMQNIGGRKGWEEVVGGGGNQGELWAINVKVASTNRLGVVLCFGQRAFIL